MSIDLEKAELFHVVGVVIRENLNPMVGIVFMNDKLNPVSYIMLSPTEILKLCKELISASEEAIDKKIKPEEIN